MIEAKGSTELYKMAEGIFIDGTTADAGDFISEFKRIEDGFNRMQIEAASGFQSALNEAEKYADEKLGVIKVIDGGRF